MKKANAVPFNEANKGELRDLLKKAQAAGIATAEQTTKVEPQHCDKNVHIAIVAVARAEEGALKADGKRYPAFADMLRAALPLMGDSGQWAAIIVDIHTTFKLRDMSTVGVQLVGIVNNARHIAYGKAATKDKGTEPAQGYDVVFNAIDKATSIITLKTALAALKVEKHASQGVPKPTKGEAKPKVATGKAEDIAIPGTRAEALKAACRILNAVLTNYLTLSEDAELIEEVQDVIEQLERKAA